MIGSLWICRRYCTTRTTKGKGFPSPDGMRVPCTCCMASDWPPHPTHTSEGSGHRSTLFQAVMRGMVSRSMSRSYMTCMMCGCKGVNNMWT